jgi:hypothetical protein
MQVLIVKAESIKSTSFVKSTKDPDLNSEYLVSTLD